MSEDLLVGDIVKGVDAVVEHIRHEYVEIMKDLKKYEDDSRLVNRAIIGRLYILEQNMGIGKSEVHTILENVGYNVRAYNSTPQEGDHPNA